MTVYLWLALLCLCVSCSGYLGWLAGIHAKRNHSYRRGYEAGWRTTVEDFIKWKANNG